MYRMILIGIDGTQTSQHALDQTLMLAKSEEAGVVLATVVPAYDGDLRIMGDKGALAAMRKPFEQALRAAQTRASRVGVQAKSVLLEGDPVEELLTLAEQCGADLVSLGKRGNYYSDLIPIGSVASKIARLAESDVLLIPREADIRLDRIIVPLDGSAPSLRAAERGTRLAARYGAHLQLVTVYELPLEGFVHNPDMDRVFYDKVGAFQKPLLLAAEDQGVRHVKAVVLQGIPAHKMLLEVVGKEKAGLVIMGSSGKGRFQHLLLGSVAERVMSCGAVPVLLTKAGKQA